MKETPKQPAKIPTLDAYPPGIPAPTTEAFLRTDHLPERPNLTPEQDHALGTRIAAGSAPGERDKLIQSLMDDTYTEAIVHGVTQEGSSNIEDHFGAGALAVAEAVNSYDPHTTEEGIIEHAESAMHDAINARVPSGNEILFSDLGENIADQRAEDAQAEAENPTEAQVGALEKLMERRLDKRERSIIEYRYGIRPFPDMPEGDEGEIPSQQQIADAMGVSSNRISQIERHALKTLQTAATPSSELGKLRG